MAEALGPQNLNAWTAAILAQVKLRPFAAASLLGLAAAGHLLARGPFLTWGATEGEATSRLPGDELLEDADGVSTRAIDIAASPRYVWPWLAQMGPAPRGGAYTYDWIENLLGLDFHSVDHVIPEFQAPQVGDTIDLGADLMRLERVEPEQVIAFRSAGGKWVWSFILQERDGGTRLISRNRFITEDLGTRLIMELMITGSLVMERKMLQGIKERAERLQAEGA